MQQLQKLTFYSKYSFKVCNQ